MQWPEAPPPDLADDLPCTRRPTMPADEVERIDERSRQMGDVIRAPEVFGPEVPVPADASAQDRLLGFLGRQP